MIRYLLASALLVALNGCTNQRWDPDEYPVKSGDTIYSIAWKYELDPFELARWNNLRSPYRIYPGQRLNMRPSAKQASSQRRGKSSSAKTRPDKIKVRKGDSLYTIGKRYDVSISQLASINGLRSPYTIHPGQTLRLTATKPVPARTSSATNGKSATKTKATATAAATGSKKAASMPADNVRIRWQWPVRGELITTFKSNKSDRKGIDIAGKEGNVIRAAAPGKVVYSGNGLISYGNLVIIKHNRTYLSAYAHNRRLLVKEGQSIKAGQKIAELGKTGADSPRLHFEIRKNGKPVNPLNYLPSS